MSNLDENMAKMTEAVQQMHKDIARTKTKKHLYRMVPWVIFIIVLTLLWLASGQGWARLPF